MIFNSDEFVFKPQRPVTRARRVLIAPDVSSCKPYPYTTSPRMISTIIDGIRRASDADIFIIGGTSDGSPIYPVYKALGYDFPRVIMLDARDSVWVEVDNPLEKPLAVPTFLMPNVVLSSDYLITTCPLKSLNGKGWLSIANLLSLLSTERYGKGWRNLYEMDIERVLADLYFTMPFDISIIEATKKLEIGSDGKDTFTPAGKIYLGEPYYIDGEAAELENMPTPYLDLIDDAEGELERQG